ncbi:MAG: hypothetical protein LBR90_03665, partial [Elusimicrobiota bacterium]|nr:hypothetical protein [Elusimicrobiota bacterium]
GWLIPLIGVCALIILFATWALRKELSESLKKIFKPQKKRYYMPAKIISNVEPTSKEIGKTPAQTPGVAKHKKPVMADYVTISQDFHSNIYTYKEPRGPFKTASIFTRWRWRKLSRKIKAALALDKRAAGQTAPAKTKEERKPLPRGVVYKVMLGLCVLILLLLLCWQQIRFNRLRGVVARQQQLIIELQRKANPGQTPKRAIIWEIKSYNK